MFHHVSSFFCHAFAFSMPSTCWECSTRWCKVLQCVGQACAMGNIQTYSNAVNHDHDSSWSTGIAASRLQYIVQVCPGSFAAALSFRARGLDISSQIRLQIVSVWQDSCAFLCGGGRPASNSKHAAKLVGPRFSSNQPRDRTFLHLQLKFAVIFPASRNSNVQSQDVPREVCQIQMNSRSNMYRLEQILWKIGVEERVLSIVQHTSDRPDLVIYWGWPSS